MVRDRWGWSRIGRDMGWFGMGGDGLGYVGMDGIGGDGRIARDGSG